MHAHAVSVIVITPDGIPLIQDIYKPKPHFWKFPGGRQEGSETPEVTAQRELAEEVGIELDLEQLELLYQETRPGRDGGGHDFFLFRAVLPETPPMKTRGNEDEHVELISKNALRALIENDSFFPNHRQFAEKFIL